MPENEEKNVTKSQVAVTNWNLKLDRLSSVGRMFAMGAITGSLDVLFNYPLINATLYAHDKNLMSNIKFKTLYKGFSGSAFCMIPATTIQFGFGAILIDNYERQMGAPASTFTKATFSAIAGAASALVVTPQEHVLTKLKNTKGISFKDMALKMQNTMGANQLFTTGLAATVCRFSIGTVCFQTFSPWLKSKIEDQGVVPSWATFFSCSSSGLIAAVATQPADRIKFWQQTKTPQKLSIRETTKEIYRMGGFANFFAASGPRMIRVTSSIALASFVNNFSR